MASDSIPEVLSQSSGMVEVLWNFSRLKNEKRLTLEDNPHFYEKLPTLAGEYVGQFRTDPVETFKQEDISVLTDNQCQTSRVYLETANGERIFGNVWVPEKAIIFKGSYFSVFPFLTP